jgi:hypothetical protein
MDLWLASILLFAPTAPRRWVGAHSGCGTVAGICCTIEIQMGVLPRSHPVMHPSIAINEMWLMGQICALNISHCVRTSHHITKQFVSSHPRPHWRPPKTHHAFPNCGFGCFEHRYCRLCTIRSSSCQNPTLRRESKVLSPWDPHAVSLIFV